MRVPDSAPWADDDDDDVSFNPDVETSELSHFDDFVPDLTSASPPEDEQPDVSFTVCNPAGTVAVTALLGGRVDRIHLEPQVSRMTESELTAEIHLLADLATKKALAAQHGVVSELMLSMGHDRVIVRDFLEQAVGLPSPERVAAYTASALSDRYGAE